MENIKYTADEQPVHEQAVYEQESPFNVMNMDGSVNFSAYEDPREACYTTISEHEEWEWVYDEPTITDNDDKFYDALESEFEAENRNDEYNYVKMKKGYQPNEEVWDVLKSTHWSSSSTVTITSLEDVLWSRDDEYQQAA